MFNNIWSLHWYLLNVVMTRSALETIHSTSTLCLFLEMVYIHA